MRTLLKNGKIYDGTGSEPFVGDVLVEDEKIVAVGQKLDEAAEETIDLGGLSLSSGFFDAHSHNDWFAIKKEPLKYFEPFIRQGATSFITGNCGLSAVGFEADSPNVDKRDAGAVQREYDRRVVGTGLAEVDEDLGDLESVIDSTSTLDKEKLKADVSELRTKVRSTLNEDVGLSDFPSNRDRALVALGNKG